MWRWVQRAALVLMGVCAAGFAGLVVLHVTSGDHDAYGRIDVPGSGRVTLPAGEVDIDYDVRLTTNGGGGALTVPDLSFTMTAPDGVRDPVVSDDVGSTVSVNNAAHVRVWKLLVKDAGTYSVTTDGDVGGFIDPELTFGRPGTWHPVPMVALGLAFLVLLGVTVFARHAASTGGSHQETRPLARPAPAAPLATGPTLGVQTPEQELARLDQLSQLTDLHAAGTLSDTEYGAAKARLGG